MLEDESDAKDDSDVLSVEDGSPEIQEFVPSRRKTKRRIYDSDDDLSDRIEPVGEVINLVPQPGSRSSSPDSVSSIRAPPTPPLRPRPGVPKIFLDEDVLEGDEAIRSVGALVRKELSPWSEDRRPAKPSSGQGKEPVEIKVTKPYSTTRFTW